MDWAFQYCNTTFPKMFDHLRNGYLCDKAEISRPRGRLLRLRLEFMSILMKIDLLLSKRQCFSSTTKGDDSHSKYLSIKRTGGIDVFDCQDDVVDCFNIHERIQYIKDLSTSISKS